MGDYNKLELWVWLLLLELALFALLPVSSARADNISPQPDGSREIVEIGVILPLSGDSAEYGVEAKRAIQILQSDLSNSGGYPIEFVFEDGHCGVGTAAVTAAQRLLSRPKTKFLLLGCSGEVLQVAPIVERKKIPAICVLCGHPDIKAAGEYIFRTYLDFESGLELLKQHVEQEKFQRIAIISETSSFTNALRLGLEQKFGDKVIISSEVSPEETDFRTILLQAKSQNPDAYYLNASSPAKYQILVKQLKSLGIKEQILSYFNPGHKTSLESLGELQDGVIFFDTPDVQNPSKDYSAFLASYNSLFKSGVESPYLLATAYNAIQAFIQAINKVGPKPSDVKQYLETQRIQGAEGPFDFDQNGDIRGPKYVLRKISAGVPSPL